MIQKRTDETKKEEHEDKAAYQLALTMIRKKSEVGKLTFPEEIFQALREQEVSTSNGGSQSEEGLKTMVMKAIEGNEDLKEISGADGLPRYYSSQYMSDAYAGLLVRKEGNPFQLIAETVRENSKVYPRPIPLNTFKSPPFELAEEEILAYLQKMKEEDPYKDIAQTTTSAGTIFLYSTLHLDPDDATMLAEWLDVGQYNNP